MASSQLIPPPALSPPSLTALAPEDRVRVWARLVDEGDAALVAGFRERAGSDTEARVALAEWLDRRGESHAATALRMLRHTTPAETHRGE